MNVGDAILCPLHSLSHKTIEIGAFENSLFEIVRMEGRDFLKYTIKEGDLKFVYDQMLLKFRFCCIGMSVVSLGQFWVEDVFYDEKLNKIWELRKVIYLEVAKEIDPGGPKDLKIKNLLDGEQIMAWIAMNYSRVFLYYIESLFLLRTSFSIEYVYADSE